MTARIFRQFPLEAFGRHMFYLEGSREECIEAESWAKQFIKGRWSSGSTRIHDLADQYNYQDKCQVLIAIEDNSDAMLFKLTWR